jgi:transcriptional regulator with XRE-family HTH domain
MAKKVVPSAVPDELATVDAKVFGSWIRAARTKAGLSIPDAAALCGVSLMFLFDLEHGKGSTQLGKALSVADQLGIRVNLSVRLGGKTS